MKRFFLLWIALSFGLNAFSQFDTRHTTPYTYFMEDVFYADSNTILVSGSNYYGTSLDGGRNWYGLSAAGMFGKASFYSSNGFGIVVGNDGKYRSDMDCSYDLGWGNISYIGVTQDLNDVFFINDYKGIVCGNAGTLLKTSDQASNWTLIETPGTTDLKGVHMINDSLALVCGNGGIVYTLKNDTVFSIQVIDAAIDFSKIYFVNETKGFLIGSNGSLYTSIDQGENWQAIDLGISDYLLNIDFSDEMHGSVCGANGIIYTTFDGGDNWTQGQVVPGEAIRAVGYKNKLVGLAVGASFLLATNDGGLTWVRTTGDLRAIDFPTDSVGYAVGYYGSAFRTEDGGNNWEPMNLKAPEYLNDVHFLNADTGFVVGGYKVFRTLDGGDTWTSIDNPAQSSLYGVHFTDYYHGVAVGYKGTIMHTDNAGETWSSTYFWNSTVYNLAVQFTSQDTGYFCTTGGRVYKTVNGGDNWVSYSTGNNTSLANIYFLNNEVGWAVGSQGKIVKTINGGEDWVAQDSGVDTYLRGVSFFNADTGMVTGSSGTYLVTEDGGEVWRNYSGINVDWAGHTVKPNGTPFAVGATRIAAIAPFNVGRLSGARCPGSETYFYTSTPYFNNDEMRTVIVEMTTENDDYSNAIPLLTVEVDSIILIDAELPEGLPEGVYKYRLRDINDPAWTSFDRYFKMTTAPTLEITIIDSVAYADSDEDGQFSWYFREGPDDYSTWIGNGDSIPLPGTGELFVAGNFACCDVNFPWTPISVCNGELTLQGEIVIENDYLLCAGDSVLISGVYYSEEGSYSDTLTSTMGCDSILISNLSILYPDSVSIDASICSDESYAFGNSAYTESGAYIDSLLNMNGCDSIVYLNLNVIPINLTAVDASICLGDSLLMVDHYYYEEGLYVDTLTNVLGCDSIISLNLSVLFQGDSIQDFTICEGDSVTVISNVYTDEGIYIDSLYSDMGCLTVFHTSVFVNENPTVFLGNDTTICENDALLLDAGSGFASYLWSTGANTQTIVVSDSGWYNVLVTDDNMCSASDSILVSVDICTQLSETLTDLGISVYPNPSGGHFYIESADLIDVKIFSIDGKLIRSIDNLIDTQEVELAQSGMFLLRFFKGNELVYVYRVVVEK